MSEATAEGTVASASNTRNILGMRVTPLTRRRLLSFKANRRGYWSFWIFMVLFFVTLFAEGIANDKPLVVQFKGDYYFPVVKIYPETVFGGDFETEAEYREGRRSAADHR